MELANFAREALQLPLYTVWSERAPEYLVFVVLHCAGGDVLIALSALIIALLLLAPESWPKDEFWRAATIATVMGSGYTIFSEWLNLVVRKSWQYSDLLLVVPMIDVRLSPPYSGSCFRRRCGLLAGLPCVVIRARASVEAAQQGTLLLTMRSWPASPPPWSRFSFIG